MGVSVRAFGRVCSQSCLMGPFIRVQSPKFAIVPGEAEELVNDGMYGKALAEYSQT